MIISPDLIGEKSEHLRRISDAILPGEMELPVTAARTRSISESSRAV
jgi:hypothetical protein